MIDNEKDKALRFDNGSFVETEVLAWKNDEPQGHYLKRAGLSDYPFAEFGNDEFFGVSIFKGDSRNLFFAIVIIGDMVESVVINDFKNLMTFINDYCQVFEIQEIKEKLKEIIDKTEVI